MLFHAVAEDLFHACFKWNTKSGERSVQSSKDLTNIVVICIVSHMSNADDFTGKYIKRTCEHDVVVIFDTIKDCFGGGSFRNLKYSNSAGKTTLKIKIQAGTGDCLTGRFGDFFMSCQDVRVGCNVVNRGTESVDITDRHGVREPFFFIIMCKSRQICVERCNWRFTVEHSWYPETSKNVHYFNGWKANKAHKVNSKIILPVNGMFSDYSWSDAFEVSHAEACISDIEKVFDFLDGNMTSYVNLHGVLARAARAGQTRNIPCKYFDVTLYKKGTMHIRFHNEELLERFNIYCSRGKNWLPPNYGKRTYADMPQEEQAVIDSFHGNGEPASGKERYAEILAKRDYYLQAPKQDFPLLTN